MNFFCSKNLSMFEKAVLVIRHPLHAFVAEINRRLQNSFEYASIEKWNSIKDIDNLTSKNMLPNWIEFHENIIKNYKHPLHIVRYESLLEDPISILSGVLGFLNVEMTNELKLCLTEDFEGPFRRPLRPQEEKEAILNKFSKESIDSFNHSYEDILKKLYSMDSIS